jgi:hypothetical protein
MKSSSTLSLLTLSTVLACASARADVIQHLHETFESGAVFDGKLTFADGYTGLLEVDGVLSGALYGDEHIGWAWNISTGVTGGYMADIAGMRNDWLMDGSPSTGYLNFIGLSWSYPATGLVVDIDPSLNAYYAGVSGFDHVLSAEVSPVPEPASVALLGLGLAGLAAARRRKGR